MVSRIVLPLALAALASLGGSRFHAPPRAEAAMLRQAAVTVVARIVARHPHDPDAFTQGLIVEKGIFYESVGLYGHSEVRRVARDTGAVLARTRLPSDQFGEGLARAGRTLVSLTWREGVAHRWDVATLKHKGSFTYGGEGWGLAEARGALILSDGSATLRFLDPKTFAEQRRIEVTLDGKPLTRLNELEVVNGAILANIWGSAFIAVIDARDGRVTRIVDLRTLVDEVSATDSDAVLNGIAWDAAERRLYVTGKLWPTLFEVSIPGVTER